MNQKFMKALMLLDRGKYNKAEENLKAAISESNNPIELIQMNSCYAGLLCELERFDESLVCADYVIENAENYDCIQELETVCEIKSVIENME